MLITASALVRGGAIMNCRCNFVILWNFVAAMPWSGIGPRKGKRSFMLLILCHLKDSIPCIQSVWWCDITCSQFCHILIGLIFDCYYHLCHFVFLRLFCSICYHQMLRILCKWKEAIFLHFIIKNSQSLDHIPGIGKLLSSCWYSSQEFLLSSRSILSNLDSGDVLGPHITGTWRLSTLFISFPTFSFLNSFFFFFYLEYILK